MQIYHTTAPRAMRELEKSGFTYVRGERMGEGYYGHPNGRRAWVDSARYQSFDTKGKHWFMIQCRASK